MKKIFLALILLVLFTGLFLVYTVGKHRALVDLDERVKESWGQVENQYQRRLDLIPNLVATVQGASDFEQETLQGVIEARSKASTMNVDVNDALSFAKFQEAQSGITSALSRLLVTVERYPELKAVEQYGTLLVQLEGTENRISTERMRYNEMVRKYNTFLRTFPNNFIAGIFGFERAQLFNADAGAEKAPAVQFE